MKIQHAWLISAVAIRPLAQMLRRLETGEQPFSISRLGQVAGVLMSFEKYQRLSGQPSGFAEKLRAWRDHWQDRKQAGLPVVDERQPDAAREFACERHRLAARHPCVVRGNTPHARRWCDGQFDTLSRRTGRRRASVASVAFWLAAACPLGSKVTQRAVLSKMWWVNCRCCPTTPKRRDFTLSCAFSVSPRSWCCTL